MKLAHTTHSVACTNNVSRDSRNNRRLTRVATTRAFSVQPRSHRVISRWHVCPETRRLECSWSLEPSACDDQLRRFATVPAGRPDPGLILWIFRG
jgi:hypothetical protein